MAPDPNFGVLIPQDVPEVPGEVLKPRETWKDKQGYDKVAHDLVRQFADNFKQYESHVDAKVRQSGMGVPA
jgi:phosphoenolpyruvate carboxykinase (ATP)